jgi:hypothetical protein
VSGREGAPHHHNTNIVDIASGDYEMDTVEIVVAI